MHVERRPRGGALHAGDLAFAVEVRDAAPHLRPEPQLGDVAESQGCPGVRHLERYRLQVGKLIHVAAGTDLNGKEPAGGSTPLMMAALLGRPLVTVAHDAGEVAPLREVERDAAPDETAGDDQTRARELFEAGQAAEVEAEVPGQRHLGELAVVEQLGERIGQPPGADGPSLVAAAKGVRGVEYDLRVSTVPTSFGENVVMRLLDSSSILVAVP